MVLVIRVGNTQEVADLYGGCTVVEPVHILRPDVLRPDVKSLVESLRSTKTVRLERQSSCSASHQHRVFPPGLLDSDLDSLCCAAGLLESDLDSLCCAAGLLGSLR